MSKHNSIPRDKTRSSSNTTTETSLPGATDRDVCASLSSSSQMSAVSSIPTRFKEEEVGIEAFLQNREVAAEKEQFIEANMKSALVSEAINEIDLRNALYEQLVTNRVAFPKSVSGDEGTHKYGETTVAILLHNWCNKKFPIMDKTLHGLGVTTWSRPDFAVYTTDNMIRFGEVKNNKNYFVEEALAQCSLYLVVLLYFIRVKMGIPVDSVFGFYVCGCKCNNLKGQYAVGLVKLSAPTVLGDPIVSYYYESKYATTDMGGIQLLVNFLKNGTTVDPPGTDISAARFTENDTPALLVLPITLWNHSCLINNGTVSIVFCGTASDIRSLLDELGGKTYRDWRRFNDNVSQVLTEQVHAKFYLKVQTKDSTLRSLPADSLKATFDALSPRYNSMYCNVEPYGEKTLGVFFMKDCGTRVDETFLCTITFSQFCVMFRKFYYETIELCMTIFHGDVLPHNIIVTEEKELMLIDLDEGTVDADASSRVIGNASSSKYPYLRYPNFLREWNHRKFYTQIQLLASFLHLSDMATKVEDNNAKSRKDMDAKLNRTILEEVAPKVNTYLEQNNNNTPRFFNLETDDNKRFLKKAIDTLESLLDLFQTTNRGI